MKIVQIQLEEIKNEFTPLQEEFISLEEAMIAAGAPYVK